VDRTVLKARTLDCAYEKNVRAMRLPIKEYAPNYMSHILNIDTMINIISTFETTKNWEKTFDLTIPLRKKTIGGKTQRKIQNSKVN
jgi:3-hydroxyacyl-CoA dehydrogenase